jgi:hypothetical protein
MPNAGWTRYSVAVVALVAFLYNIATGEVLPDETKRSWEEALAALATNGALIWALGASLYSKFFPSQQGALVPDTLKAAPRAAKGA